MRPPIETNSLYPNMNLENTITFHESLSIEQQKKLLETYNSAKYFKIFCETKTLIKTRKELEYELANVLKNNFNTQECPSVPKGSYHL